MGFISTKWRANPWPSELKQAQIPPNITVLALKTTLKEVLEVLLEVLEVVLEVLQLLLQRFLKNLKVTLPKSRCS